METEVDPLLAGRPKAEFKDTPASIQIVEAGICVVGGISAYWLFKSAQGNPIFWAASAIDLVLSLIAVLVIHKIYGSKTSLKHFHDSIVLDDRGKERTIPFDQLEGFSAAWTDLYVNMVYSSTNVKFDFQVEGAFKTYSYDSSANRGTLKYEQLEALQGEMTEVVLSRMRETLLAESFVPWTSQLTITTVGIDYRKKGTGEPQLIPFHRLGKWEVSQGVFKLALDDDRRPSITERTSQTNFFPGLTLFAQLQAEFGDRSESLAAESQADYPSPPPAEFPTAEQVSPL